MIIKKYIVNNMNEAMTRIRYELGKDAIIISQRKIRKPGFKGLFSKRSIEVTAAIENLSKIKPKDEVQDSIEAIRNLLVNDVKENIDNKEIKKQSTFNKKEDKETNLLSSNKTHSLEENTLMKEMQDIKHMINHMAKATDKIEVKSKEEDESYALLKNNDVDEEIIKDILKAVEEMDDSMEKKERIKESIKDKIHIASEDSFCHKVVLVGPTGVGKTTTIAKLAGRMALIEKRKVGLITVDTYRIGAVEQLKTYAEIMSIPFRVVINQKEMEEAIEAMKDRDVVLVDTTGRSSKNVMQISELRAFIDKVNTPNVHLVLSSTTKNKDMKAIIQGYKVLNYNNIIITKLDETSTYGSLLNILTYGKKPLSMVTVGQNVPDDIRKITKEDVSKLVLGEDSIC